MNFLTHIYPGTSEIVRSCSIEGDAWFNASELCRMLGHSNVTKALNFLEPQEKMTVTSDSLEMSKMDISSGSHGGARRMVLVNESGLYGLMFRSRHPMAVRFRLWVTGVVLPAIRDHGFYSVFPDSDEAEKAKLNARVAGQMNHIKGAVEALREPVPEGYGSLSSLLESFGMEVDAGGRLRAANAVRQACREQGASILYRWRPKDWRAIGYYPREIAKEALLKALPEAEPTPDLFETFERKEGV